MKKRKFGQFERRAVDEVTLESADAAVSILSFGCILRDWRVDGPDGTLPMVLGFPEMDAYDRFSRSHGAIVGRIANRTRDARFDLEGRTYELTPNHGPNNRHHIHGGATGLGRRIWDMETEAGGNAVHLSYASPDGEEGYPGAVRFDVAYRLEGPRLICEMRGVPDRPTPINLAHHAYFNLGGGGTVKDHALWVDAEAYTPLDADLIPLGTIEPVEGTTLDFREAREIGDTPHRQQFRFARGPRSFGASGLGRIGAFGDEADGPDRPAGAAGLRRGGDDDRRARSWRRDLRAFRGPLLRGAAFPGLHAQPGLAEHRLDAGTPLFPALRRRDRPELTRDRSASGARPGGRATTGRIMC